MVYFKNNKNVDLTKKLVRFLLFLKVDEFKYKML